MQIKSLNAILTPAVCLATVLLLGTGIATAQSVSLTAGPATTTLPDGSVVPMWGYTCSTTVAPVGATCAASNPSAAGAWSPVVITVPSASAGASLTINLTNNLTFTAGSVTNTVPTSLTIVGQVGGGLGTPTSVASPPHSQLGVSWPTVTAPGAGPTFTPPPQGPRVQSFGTEVAANTTTPLTWSSLTPGTYLLESGTHPSIQGPMGLYGIVVVTTAATTTAAGTAYPVSGTSPAVTYDAEVPVLLSEIDPVQNSAVQAAVTTSGFSETAVWSGQPGGCGNPQSPTYHTCYPPAVNYTPLYYMINGVAFSRTNSSASLFPVSPATIPSTPLTGTPTGSVLVRLVNAGVKMHVPSIVGSLTGTANPPASGFSIIAEDGHRLPGLPKVQHEVFMAPGKTYDVMINGPAAGSTAPAFPIYDRELSLSGNKVERDAGMLAYISVNGAGLPTAPALAAAVARQDTYTALIAGQTLSVSDPAKGVIANDTNVYGVQLLSAAVYGTVTLNPDGTFTYVPSGAATSDSFSYCANGSVTAGVCSSGISATVILSPSNVTDSGITCTAQTFNSTIATYLAVKTPGVLAGCVDGAKLPLTVVAGTVKTASGNGTVILDANGGFTASVPAAGTYTFTFQAQNSQGKKSAAITATVNFPTASNLAVTVLDGYDKTTTITDYRWIIEEDRTFYIDPTKTTNTGTSIVPTLGVNFHTSNMPFVAQGCTGPQSCEGGQMAIDPATGQHSNVVCDVGNGVCRPDLTGNGFTQVLPSQVHLDPTKRYYISVLPGDAADPFYGASSTGHGMGGAPIGIDPNTGIQASSVTILTQPSPYPPGKLSVIVFEDDFPLNGEQDAGGGIDVLATNEPGLGGFQIHLWDAMGGNGDFTGQMTYDMFNQPLTNSLAGTVDPATGNDACPIVKNPLTSGTGTTDPTATGITGMIVTCPRFESDGSTLSPLAGEAVVANLMPGRWGVIATPGADRIARGEEWLQTNTLDGQKAHDVFTRIGEPNYFQEFGPASFHVSIGFASPAVINGRHAGVCNGTDLNLTASNCTNTLTGRVTSERLSRTPDERLYSSGSHDAYYWTQCYVSFGDPDGEDFAFTKCNADGTFTMTGLPDGDWRVTTFDQWNDQLVDGLSTPVRLNHAVNGGVTNMGDIATTQWQANLYTRTFIDDNKDGVSQADEAGIPFANVAVRLRDGSLENLLVTDFTGTANFNETFPLFSWYTVETDVTRYKNTGTHVVYDAGGPADGSAACTAAGGNPPCGNSVIGKFLANTVEQVSVPANLRVPGAVYCAGADCAGKSVQNGPGTSDPPSVCTTSSTGVTTCSTTLSTGRVDPPWAGGVEGWQGFPGQNNFIEFGKEPYAAGENGGIKGHVIYASTRPFDDPQMLVQTQWEPLVPHVTINLYQEGVAADGVTPTLTMVDTTQTSSWDDYAQGFRQDGVTPNMNCPGQGAASGPAADLFFYSLFNQPDYLDLYNNQHNGTPLHTLPNNSQFKCYDGMHNWNQVQPAPYDGMYQFPSVNSVDPTTGKPNSTNCTICSPNNAVPATDLYYGLPMLPAGKYVVEVVVPPGYELVKEEDKNILIGDNFIAPVTQQFGGLGSIFILPDQASVASQGYPGPGYNQNNAQNPTQSLGAEPQNGIVPGFVPEPVWPCVGESRIVPDYISLFPQSKQVAPFAGATRNLCDRKEVTLGDQMGAIAKFYIYTSTHIASKFTGGITDDFTSEFDPFAPTFGEKFSPPDMPVSVKDWTGAEISRVYADQWGSYDGMTYSTWEVNPPNPTGYSPTMMIFCMNDPGPITDTRPGSATLGQQINDPLFAAAYSQFCYELPFMPGTTQYLDTPVVPTSAFAGAGYNNVDCDYPALTPSIASVNGDGVGPWVSKAGNTLTITALGDQTVYNYGYSGPSATTAPFNEKTVTRHYGFGATKGTVTIGGVTVPAATVSWSDATISFAVPAGIPNCGIQQQAQYGGSTAQCGQLVITTAAGQQSVDTVTVTVGGKAPTVLTSGQTIQSAIDAAAPGDLIIVPPGTYNEILIMWKPVRLQGVGAASTIVNANAHPAGKLDPWRAQVACLFGLALNGQPNSNGSDVPNPAGTGDLPNNPFDPTGLYTCPGNGWNNYGGRDNNPQVDRIPLEAVVGWDTTVNGNLAQLLQEPSLMGAYEGAAITVLAKGVRYPAGVDVFGNGPDTAAGANIAHEGQMPLGTALLTNSTADCDTTSAKTGYTSNFQCNPSRIDGLALTDSSQGGGGIYVHGWAHNLEIANNRIYGNTGTLTGGITIGQGESPDALISGNGGDPLAPTGGFDQQPWTCVPDSLNADGSQNPTPTGYPTGTQMPYCYNTFVNIHNNSVSKNSSIGDEVFSGTPAGAGGVSLAIGSDFYKFNYNWVCGNLSTGDGGGVAHIGFNYKGDMEHNTILFNQSTNPTIPTNGGGIVVMGAAPDGTITPGNSATPECGSVTDVDCAPGLTDGTGPGLIINANLIMGNGAESGSGGGIRFQDVDGTDVAAFPNGNASVTRPDIRPGFVGIRGGAPGGTSTTYPSPWNTISATNNIIVNNVAGWDGAGVSLQDALAVDFINNTVASNDTTASSGVLFNTIGAPDASAPGPCPGNTNPSAQTPCVITSTPQPAGLVTMQNTSLLTASLNTLTVTCPTGHGTGGTGITGLVNANCRNYSVPRLYNDLFWQNRSFYISVGSLGTGTQNQQNVVSLYTGFTATPATSQPMADAIAPNGTGIIITGGTGACVTPNAALNYWDIGARGDTGPANHSSGITLNPTYSVISNFADYNSTALHNTGSNPTVLSQYCNGSRVPPENGGLGYQVPPGISDATVPNPIFSLTPTATVDEGNNWINISWGPLALTGPVTGSTLGNYGLASSSSAINYIPPSAGVPYTLAPTMDFYGNPRKTATDPNVDAGAVEYHATGTVAIATITGGPLSFGNVLDGTTSPSQTLVLHNTGNATLTGITLAFTGPFSRPAGAAGGTCGATLTVAAGTCTIDVVFSPVTPGAVTGSLTVTANVVVTGSPVGLSGTGVVPTHTASVTPSPLAFGSWTTGTTSNPLNLTVTNTGNSALGGGTFTFGGGTPQPFARVTTGTFPAGAPNCGAALAVGASCTIKVTFAPTTAATFSRTLTVAYTGATVTPTPVTLTGTGIAARGTVSITPNPLTITLPTGTVTGTGIVMLTNTTAAGGSSVAVNTVGVSGGSILTYFFNVVAGSDNCSGTNLAPGASCSVTIRFTNVLSARGANRAGTVTFTDTATGSPQSGGLIGHAN